MTVQAETDERLREAVGAWLAAHDRGHPGELPGDLVMVMHFRSWGENDLQVDDYEVIVPAGTSYHAAVGLLSHGIDIHTGPDEDEE